MAITGTSTEFQNSGFTVDTLTVSGTATLPASTTFGSQTLSSTELGFLDGVTAGTAAASKAVVLNGSKTVSGVNGVLSTGTAGLGYATGAGGAVTQGTSRTTGVTLNTITGAITLFTAAGSATAATFTVTNSTVAATDTVIVNAKSGTNVYLTAVTAVAAGSFNITFWTTGGTSSDAPVFNFSVIKGVAA